MDEKDLSQLDWTLKLFGEEIQTKDGLKPTREALMENDVLCIYFSAHWCSPCQAFTPTLSQAYAEYQDNRIYDEDNDRHIGIDIVFVSSDASAPAFDGYYDEMPWKALPFAAREAKVKLAEKFGVRGVPMLVVLDG